MGVQPEIKKYELLSEYAERNGVTLVYLVGAIHGSNIDLPIFSGAMMVDDEGRALLDPIVANIKDRVDKERSTKRRGRPRKILVPSEPSPA